MAELSKWLWQQFLDGDGNPYNGAKLFFYEAGTTTKKDVYTTSTGDVAHSNPIVLDSTGKPGTGAIFFGTGSYKIVLAPSTDTDPPASPIKTIDDITGLSGDFAVVNTMTDLKALSAGDYTMVAVLGYSSVSDDIGVRFYRWNSSSTASDDGGYIIEIDDAPGTGRFELQYDEYLNPKWFGAVGDGTTDDQAKIQATIDVINTNGQEADIHFSNGIFRISSNLTLPPNVNSIFTGDAQIKIDAAVTLTVSSHIDDNYQSIFDNSGNVVFTHGKNSQIWANWFGAVGDGTTDDQAAIQKALDSAGELTATRELTVKLKAGTYVIGSTLIFPTTASLALEGSGVNSTFISHSVNSDNAIEFPLSGSTTRLSNLTLFSESTSNTAVYFNLSGDDYYLSDVLINGFGKAIDTGTSSNIFMENVFVKNCVNDGLVVNDGCKNVTFSGVIDGNSTASSVGITIESALNVNIDAVVSGWVTCMDIGDNVSGDDSVVRFNGTMKDFTTQAILITGNCNLSGNSLHIDNPRSSSTSCFEFSGTSKTANFNFNQIYISDSAGDVPYILKQSGTTCTMNLTIGTLNSDNSDYLFSGSKLTDMTSASVIKELNTGSIRTKINSGNTFGEVSFDSSGATDTQTVNTAAIEADSLVFLTAQSTDVTMHISNIVAGTSFDINTSPATTGTVVWQILKP